MNNQSKKFNFLLFFKWWQVDQSILLEQTANYGRLPFLSAYKNISTLLLVFSSVVSAVLSFTTNSYTNSWVDSIIFLILAIFCFKGKKWAFLISIIWWTIEKGYSLYLNPRNIISVYLFWNLYVYYFYYSYVIEKNKLKDS